MEGSSSPELDRRRVAFVYQSSAGPYTSDRLIARSVQVLASSVDDEFSALGLPSIFPNVETLDACALLEGVYAVLIKFRDMRTCREDLEERISKLCSDLNHSRTICNRLQGELERVQRENGAVAEKCRQAQVKCDSSRGLWRREQDENRRLRLWLAQRDSQHLHETRRLENEIDRLKAKLNHLLITDARKRSQKDGFKIELVNPLTRSSEGKRLTWKTEAAVQKHERDLNQFAREKLDERLKTLVAENVEMRRTVSGLYEILADNGLLSGASAGVYNAGAFQLPWNTQPAWILKDMTKALETIVRTGLNGNAGGSRNGNVEPPGNVTPSSSSEAPSEDLANNSPSTPSVEGTVDTPLDLISAHRRKARRRLSSHSSGSGGSGTGSGGNRRRSRGSLVNSAEIEDYMRSVNAKNAGHGMRTSIAPQPPGGAAAHSVATYERVTSPSHCSVILGAGGGDGGGCPDGGEVNDNGNVPDGGLRSMDDPPPFVAQGLSRVYQGKPRLSPRVSCNENSERPLHQAHYSSSHSSTTCAEQTQNIVGFPGSFKVTVSVTDSQQQSHHHQEIRREDEKLAPPPDGSDEDDDDDEDDTRSVIMKNDV